MYIYNRGRKTTIYTTAGKGFTAVRVLKKSTFVQGQERFTKRVEKEASKIWTKGKQRDGSRKKTVEKIERQSRREKSFCKE
jgi:hypothetical protein